ncbi:elongation factor Ts [Buchnera aphidicola (Hyadaphis tataricae)]|uniref:Elongation factor Ts n=1 Tax=Buchnera aphidicola (Hyadaphis tataricae) TaxID=1241859 RepID=A0A4D6Y681_9GAMM|nr:translation elongation factor Ts [Buchnera aphidicola]QCI21541.1 elongation factor Ts [Buchnera aphidicola (Hyadaphis tataricae)]
MKTNITASLIKKLRSYTGAGIVECKRALIESNGDIEQSIDNLRKSGKVYAAKKMNNITNQGAIFSGIIKHIGAMIELNCETDFVSKDDLFVLFGKEIISTALKKEITNIEHLKNVFEEKRANLIFKTGENINIRRFVLIKSKKILSYVHGVRIGVLIDAHGVNDTILKNIAMHIAASKPQYLHPQHVSDAVFKREYHIQLELAKKLKKPDNILKKIISGKMNKFVNDISLTSQNFIMDSNKTVQEILNQYNLHINSFHRFELGEVIS